MWSKLQEDQGHSGFGVSFHARHTWFSEVVGALDDCGGGLYGRVLGGWGGNQLEDALGRPFSTQ